MDSPSDTKDVSTRPRTRAVYRYPLCKAQNCEKERVNAQVRTTRSEEKLDPLEGGACPQEDDWMCTCWITYENRGSSGLDGHEAANLTTRMNEDDHGSQIHRATPLNMDTTSRVSLDTFSYASLPWKGACRRFSMRFRKMRTPKLRSSPIKKMPKPLGSAEFSTRGA